MKVKFIDESVIGEPFYPEVGTIGEVIEHDRFYSFLVRPDEYIIQWPKGSTTGDDRWLVPRNMVNVVEE